INFLKLFPNCFIRNVIAKVNFKIVNCLVKHHHVSASLLCTTNTQPKPKKETVEVTFIKANGEQIKAKGKEGDSLLDIVVNSSVDIDGYGACEGTLTCSTCHLIFKKEDFDRLPDKPTDEELDMLDLAYDLTETSRLGCQIIMSKELNGLEVKVPASVNDAQTSPPKKNIRRRVIGSIDDEEGGDENENKMEVEENNIQVQGNVTSKTKEKKKERRKQSVLSFEEELNEADDGEVFQVKKSTQSKKIMKLLDKERKKKKEIKKEEEKPDSIEKPKDDSTELVVTKL
ncbi:hypothetical protein L9F63_009999, partial [Diploptera punctata]